MRIEAHGRRLKTLRGKETSGAAAPLSLPELHMQAVHDIDRERRAALILARFAQDLGGMPERPPPEPISSTHAETELPPAPVPLRPRWTKDIRPGPHDLLTWEEAMQVPWYDPFEEEQGGATSTGLLVLQEDAES